MEQSRGGQSQTDSVPVQQEEPWQAACRETGVWRRKPHFIPDTFKDSATPPPRWRTRRRRTWSGSLAGFESFQWRTMILHEHKHFTPFFKNRHTFKSFPFALETDITFLNPKWNVQSQVVKPYWNACGGFGGDVFIYTMFWQLERKKNTKPFSDWFCFLWKTAVFWTEKIFWAVYFHFISCVFLVEGLASQLLRSSFYADCLEERRRRNWAPVSARAKPLNFIQGGSSSFSSSLGGQLQESHSVCTLFT